MSAVAANFKQAQKGAEKAHQLLCHLLHCDRYPVLYLLYFIPPNVYLSSLTAHITLQGLKIHVFLVKRGGFGARACPVATGRHSTDSAVTGGGLGARRTRELLSPPPLDSHRLHLHFLISMRGVLFRGLFQEEGKRNDGKCFSFPCLSLRLAFSALPFSGANVLLCASLMVQLK